MFEQAAAISQSDTPLCPNLKNSFLWEKIASQLNLIHPSIKSGILLKANHLLNPLDGIFWTQPPFQTAPGLCIGKMMLLLLQANSAMLLRPECDVFLGSPMCFASSSTGKIPWL